MSIDFEQTKRELRGRSILVTSWYDEQKRNWRASAPAYTHVRALSAVDQEACASRKAAIDHVISLLATHLAGKEGVSSGQILFR